MTYSNDLKRTVIALREQGTSINAIASQTGLAKSTVSLWVRNTALSPSAQTLLRQRKNRGRQKGNEVMRARKLAKEQQSRTDAEIVIRQTVKAPSQEMFQIWAALLYWCEGGKRANDGVRFANSDPLLVKAFLRSLRKGFDLDESRFSVVIHLHEYHNPKKQLQFWSEITNIPAKQFLKPYLKPNTGKRQKDDYPGCVSVRYKSSELVLKLKGLYYSFAESIEGM